AFSCKGRAFCPSCGGRRMADTAAHLVDRVLPDVPVRQWVLTLPFPLRFRMGYDARLTSDVLRAFLRTVFASLRRRAGRRWAIRWPQCGAVTFIQRFGDALNLNVHFHALVLDGIYEGHPDQELRFHPLPPPDRAEMEHILRGVARRLARLLKSRGLGPDDDPAASFSDDEPLLATLYAASVRGRTATGPRAGQRPLRLGDRIDPEDLLQRDDPLCVSAGGLGLHAGVAVPARDRKRLERLCRYVSRPPVSTERLSRLPDGRLLYRLKRRWRDGTTHVVFEAMELVERLAALVPPPRAHQVRYSGILGPCASQRPRVVPATPEQQSPVPDTQSNVTDGRSKDREEPPSTSPPDLTGYDPAVMAHADAEETPSTGAAATRTRQRLTWAALMQRVFAADVLECPRCQGRMRIIATIREPATVRAILDCLDLPARAPPNEPPRPAAEPLLPGAMA
ncbi:MAG: transposase, partial [Rhodospirillales bacterium]